MRGGTTPRKEFAGRFVTRGGVDPEALADALRGLIAVNKAVYKGSLASRVVDP